MADPPWDIHMSVGRISFVSDLLTYTALLVAVRYND